MTSALSLVRPAVPTHPSGLATREAAGEEALVERARRGDVDAFERLYHLHARTRARALPAAGGRADGGAGAGAGHVHHAWEALPRFRGESSLTTWLHRIAVNAMLERRRRDRRRTSRVSLAEDDEDDAERASIGAGFVAPADVAHGDRSGAGDRRAAAGRATRVRAARGRGIHARGSRRDDRPRDGHAAGAAASGATTVDQGTEPMNEHTSPPRRSARRADGRAATRDRAAARAVERDPRRARAAVDARVAVGATGVSPRRGC